MRDSYTIHRQGDNFVMEGQDTIPLIGDPKYFWDMMAQMYADPRQVNFRKSLRENSPVDAENLFSVHPELRDYKEPATETRLVVNVQFALKSNQTSLDAFSEWLENTRFQRSVIPIVDDFQIESVEGRVVMARPNYRIGDVFDNPISVEELEL